MGFVDDAKDALGTAGEKIKREVHDLKERAGDKKDEIQADAEVKKAEADRDSVHQRNEVKDQLRD